MQRRSECSPSGRPIARTSDRSSSWRSYFCDLRACSDDADVARTSEPPTSATVVRGRWLNSPIPLVVLVLMAAVVPFVVERQDILNLLFLVFLYMSMGQSWNILAGFAGQINLGHAAFFGAGALVSRSLWIGGTPIGLAILAGCVAAVAFAL